MPQLADVFGIRSEVPKWTYVDRSALDERIKYLLGVQRHIVIHGGSKQGKTVLRLKNLPRDCITVRCLDESNLESVASEIHRQLGTMITSETSTQSSVADKISRGIQGKLKIPPLELGGSAGASKERKSAATRKQIPVDQQGIGLQFLAEQIRESKRRLVIEDFHYLPEGEKRRFAHALKALHDENVFVVIVGIWAEQNLLTYFNGDLRGRVEEIDLRWTASELGQVLFEGEQILNIYFAPALRDAILSDANENVGLLQSIAEKCCYAAKVKETCVNRTTIDNLARLQEARENLCSDLRQRYFNFFGSIIRGFRGPKGGDLRVYEHLVRVCVDALDSELLSGLYIDQLLARIKEREPRISRASLVSALERINKLQQKRQVRPPVLAFVPSTQRLQLVDREFLFFRRYNREMWPWQQP